MAWLALLAAILLEVCGTTSMKLSRGFSVPGPTLAIFAFYAASIVCLTFAVHRLEIGVAYAIWSALGTAIVAVIGIAWFGESVTAGKLVSLGLVVLGVVGLQLSAVAVSPSPPAAAGAHPPDGLHRPGSEVPALAPVSTGPGHGSPAAPHPEDERRLESGRRFRV